MATGRKYIVKHLHRRNRVNRFTADTYDSVCSDIYWANVDNANKKHVIVKHAKNKMAGVSSLVKAVLKQNNITVQSYGKYASTNVKTVFRFATREDALKAVDIINAMVNDLVNRSAVTTSGENVTSNGVKIKVDLTTGSDGSVQLVGGTTYVPSNTGAASEETEGSGVNWYLVGGAALVGVILVIAVVKLMKKK